MGDWNIVLEPSLDTLNYQTLGNPRARAQLIDKMTELGLVDIFREFKPNDRKYTWKQWGSHKYSRIDYFLVSNSLVPFVQNVDILPKCYSDHSPILLDLDFTRFNRGRGFWKMNNSLLYDTEYVEIVKQTIKRVTTEYAIINNDENFYQNVESHILDSFLLEQTPESLQILQLKINPELFLDTLLMEIRRMTILFSARKKRERIALEQLLNHDIEILELNLQQNPVNNETMQVELDEKRAALEDMYNYQAHGAYIRSRAAYKMAGEKSTRMFCNLEKYNGCQKYVPQLIVSDENDRDKTLTNQDEVEQEIFDFYKNLYSCKDDQINIDSISDFLGPVNLYEIPKVNNTDKESMEGKITVEEMTSYLKKSKNNVAPGSSGFTNEFYKFFWRDIKSFVINSVDYAFEHNRLSVSQKLGIISIIPKGDKDKRYLTNWRPLTLLNTLYKLISGCIAERIKPVLKKIIHPDQKGFVPERYIGEAIRTTYDIMHYAKAKKIAGLMLLIDFEKAYDSISFKYINKVLNFFNFGKDMVNWIEMLLNNFSAVINHCGNISSKFEIARGCRQGDPVASYLFILCIEILAIKLRSDNTVQAMKLGNLSHLMEIYADDLTMFLEPFDDNLRNAIEVLNDFFRLSGLKVSVSKTKAVWFGSEHDSNRKLCHDLQLKWVKSFTLLGINFDSALATMSDNFDNAVQKIENMFSSWSYRYLTPFGKVTVIKSLGLSKLSLIALVIPNPTIEKIKRIESIFFKFLWGQGSEKVRRDDCKLPINHGGLNMPDISKFWTAFKFSWLRRMLKTNAFWPKLLLQDISNFMTQNLTVSDLLQLGIAKIKDISKNLENTFWKQVLMSTAPLVEGYIFSNPGKIINSPLWYNPLIIRPRIIKYGDFPEISNHVNTLADFFYPGTNEYMQLEDFQERFNCVISEEKYVDIRYTIRLALQKLNLPITRLNPAHYPLRPILIDIAMSTTKGCSYYNKLLSLKSVLNNKIQLREIKWHAELGSTFSVFFWNNARKHCANIFFDNQLKWLQFQVVRNSLQTNYIVNHFKPNIPKICSYCKVNSSIEIISHIYWFCPYISDFLNEVSEFLNDLGLEYNPTKEQFLFGFQNTQAYQLKNFLSLVIKKYIWKSKFKTAILTMDRFKTILKTHLCDLRYMFQTKNLHDQFNEWNTIYDAL